MIGLYLDALAKAGEWEAIDRVIEAQQWITDDYELRGARCLLGHAENWSPMNSEVRLERFRVIVRGKGDCQVGWRFDYAVKRFGMDRVVRCIKLRAGRHTRLHPPESAPSTALVGAAQ